MLGKLSLSIFLCMIRAVLSEPKSLLSTSKQYGRNLSTTSKKIIFRIIFVKTKHWKIMTKRRKKRIMKQKLFHVNELSREILEFDWVARIFSFFVLYPFSCVNLFQRVVTSTFQQFIVIFQVFLLDVHHVLYNGNLQRCKHSAFELWSVN